jgi:alpha-galactosidase
MLEVWAGPLTDGRWAVSLFNRSPAADTITVSWDMLGQNSAASFAVRDIWAAADVGTFTGQYSASVAAHSTAFLVLTPSA